MIQNKKKDWSEKSSFFLSKSIDVASLEDTNDKITELQRRHNEDRQAFLQE